MMDLKTFNQEIDRYAKKWDTSGIVMVYKDKAYIHDQVYGYKDRFNQELLTEQDTYALSLRSHFFMGLALMVLIDQNKIDLDQTIDTYLPEYSHGNQIKIKHLIAQQSGIPDPIFGEYMINLQNQEDHHLKSEDERYRIERVFADQNMTFKEIWKYIKDRPLDFEPGERDYFFSLSAYIVLEEIVLRITGMNLFTYLEMYAFKPWGLNVKQGAFQSTISYGCIMEDRLIRLETNQPMDHAITLSKMDVQALMMALLYQKGFKKSTWKKALKYDSRGNSLIAENANGISCIEAQLLGFEINLYFDPDYDLSYVHLTNELQIMKNQQGEWFYFRKDMRKTIEVLTTYPKFPRLVKYQESNAWHAMGLTVAKGQEGFVLDAKASLAFALINPRVRKAYVLMEKTRAVGLLVLSINPKKNYYNVDVVLIDYHYQKRGYGKIMIQEALRILKSRGAKRIEIGVNRFNLAAQKLYTSAGFSALSVYDHYIPMGIDLDT